MDMMHEMYYMYIPSIIEFGSENKLIDNQIIICKPDPTSGLKDTWFYQWKWFSFVERSPLTKLSSNPRLHEITSFTIVVTCCNTHVTICRI